MEPIEVAFSYIGDDKFWQARVTWKCQICGRRNCELKNGQSDIADDLPLEMKCKQGHVTRVVPYYWKESKVFNKDLRTKP